MDVLLRCEINCTDSKMRSIEKMIKGTQISANVGDYIVDHFFRERVLVKEKSIDFTENTVTLDLEFNTLMNPDDLTVKTEKDKWKIVNEWDWIGVL